MPVLINLVFPLSCSSYRISILSQNFNHFIFIMFIGLNIFIDFVYGALDYFFVSSIDASRCLPN